VMSALRRMTVLLGMVTAVLGMVLIAPSAQAETPALQPSSAVDGDAGAAGWYPPIEVGYGRDACPKFYVCIWTDTNFRGAGRGYNGDLVHGDRVSWFGTVWQDNVYSAVNKGTVPITFYDIHGATWTSLGTLYPGYDFSSGWPGANKADGMAYA
jgi:hypothetical protein